MGMTAVYDLARNPPTYDVVTFLGHVQQHRRLNYPFDKVDLVIIPGPQGGFRPDTLWPRSLEQRRHMRDNVVVPICEQFRPLGSVTVADTRSGYEQEFGFGKNLISLANFVQVMRWGIHPISRAPDDYTFPHKRITFTLREAEHHPPRNSNVQAWLEAAYRLLEKGYDVVIVRDTRFAGESLGGIPAHPTASTSIKDRADLYANSSHNLGVNNGPMWFAWLMNTPVSIIRPTTQMGGCYDDAFFKRNGVPRGSQFPNENGYQRLVWEEDTADNIVRVVEAGGTGVW